MVMSYRGTSAFGLRLPLLKQGDDLKKIVVETLKNAKENGEYNPQEDDIIGLTESIVARTVGKYATIDDVVKSLGDRFRIYDSVYVYNPIFSRNRFSIILRAIATRFKEVVIISDPVDEVGNDVLHEITLVNYRQFYEEICKEQGATMRWIPKKEIMSEITKIDGDVNIIDCTLHPEFDKRKNLNEFVKYIISSNRLMLSMCGLVDICDNISQWGLLGSNKMGEDLLKLYPDKHERELIHSIQNEVKNEFGLKEVHVMIYGDGCYKDATSGIWEFADPVVSPVYTDGLEGTPAELKLKYLIDNEFGELDGDELKESITERIKNKSVKQGTMETQGTTPRRYTDLLGSLMDLMSGSGDKGTPVIIVQDYFKNYSM